MSIRPQAPAPFLSEEVAERLLALPTPPPSSLPYSSPTPQIPLPPLPIPSQPPNSPTYVEGSLGSRAARIRQRDALPSPVHETEMPEICLPLRKRPCRTTPGPGYEVGEIMLERSRTTRTSSRVMDYGITDTWDDLEDEIILFSGWIDADMIELYFRARVTMLYRDRAIHRALLLMGRRPGEHPINNHH
ncbi:hypothetical protein Tco_0083445 [Tanacetum coccineum]